MFLSLSYWRLILYNYYMYKSIMGFVYVLIAQTLVLFLLFCTPLVCQLHCSSFDLSRLNIHLISSNRRSHNCSLPNLYRCERKSEKGGGGGNQEWTGKCYNIILFPCHLTNISNKFNMINKILFNTLTWWFWHPYLLILSVLIKFVKLAK